MHMTPALIAVAFAASAASTSQRTPDDLVDLVGASAATGEVALLSRGFRFVGYSGEEKRRYTWWWNAKLRTCVAVAIIDNHFALITALPAIDCHGKAGVTNVPGMPPR